jgi:hypothetical protein
MWQSTWKLSKHLPTLSLEHLGPSLHISNVVLHSCRILLVRHTKTRKKYAKLPQNIIIRNATLPQNTYTKLRYKNKYTIIFHSKALQSIPKLVFLVPSKIYHLATLERRRRRRDAKNILLLMTVARYKPTTSYDYHDIYQCCSFINLNPGGPAIAGRPRN